MTVWTCPANGHRAMWRKLAPAYGSFGASSSSVFATWPREAAFRPLVVFAAGSQILDFPRRAEIAETVNQPITFEATAVLEGSFALRNALAHLSIFSLAGLLVACSSTGSGQKDSSGAGGQGGKRSPDAGQDTSTSPGSGGVGGTGGTKASSGGTTAETGGTTAGSGGTKAATGGTRDASSSVQGGSAGTSQTGGSGKVDAGEASGGVARDGGGDGGAGGSPGRSTSQSVTAASPL
jgi:hypothetical protein